MLDITISNIMIISADLEDNPRIKNTKNDNNKKENILSRTVFEDLNLCKQ